MSPNRSGQKSDLSLHFFTILSNLFYVSNQKVVHYSSEKSDKCQSVFSIDFASFGVYKHYCTLCNN